MEALKLAVEEFKEELLKKRNLKKDHGHAINETYSPTTSAIGSDQDNSVKEENLLYDMLEMENFNEDNIKLIYQHISYRATKILQKKNIKKALNDDIGEMDFGDLDI